MVRKLLPLAASLAVCSAAAASAQAMTISLGEASLSGRVAVTEPVTVSCTPFDPSLTLVGESINVTAEQASGRSIAHGTGGTMVFGSSLLFPAMAARPRSRSRSPPIRQDPRSMAAPP